jgi:hypothetical protein
MWAMTNTQWERVEAGRCRLRNLSPRAGADPAGQVWRAIFGDDPLIEDHIEPAALVSWLMAQLAFVGEWVPRERLECLLEGNVQALGVSPEEISSRFDDVLEIVENVGPARSGGAD